jgi:hypothetical protein
MNQRTIDVIGLFLTVGGALSGMVFGSCLFGDPGAFLGLTTGALSGFDLAQSLANLCKGDTLSSSQILQEAYLSLVSEPEETSFPNPRKPWFARFWKRPSSREPRIAFQDFASLEDIYGQLKSINSRIWRELRTGVLAGCHAGLYSVHVSEAEESLDWREVNRRTVSALHRFETAASEEERRLSLQEALDRLGQKLIIVQRAAARKTDRLNGKEKEEIQRHEVDLWHLSRLIRSYSLSKSKS